MPTKEELEKGFTLGDWEVVPARRLLRSGDTEFTPEPKVFGVLMSLAQRDGDGVTRDELIDEVWDGRPTGDEPINRCIAQLRSHLGDKRPYRYVETLQKSGYRLKEKIQLYEAAAPAAVEDAPPARPPSVMFRGFVVLLIMAMVVAVIWGTLSNREVQPGVRTIAVLPFVNVSGDESNQYLVEGFKQELIKTLQPIPQLKIKTGRDSYSGKTPPQIAIILGVDSVLFGRVNRIGDELQVTYELVDGMDSTSLAAGSVTGDIQGLFDLQVTVAKSVRNELFGSDEQFLVSKSRPASSEAYLSFLQGNFAFDKRGSGDNFDEAIRLFEATIEQDPSFGPAYLQLATAYALAPVYQGASLDESNRKAILTVEQGIAADASIEEAAGAVSGFIFHRQKEWTKSELAYQKATNAETVDSNAFNWYSRMLASVGRLDEALNQSLEAFDLDPESAVIASRLALSYSWVGDAEKASQHFELAHGLGAGGSTHLMGWALFLAREGQIDESREIAKIAANQAGLPPEWIDDVIAGMLDEEKTAAALLTVNQTVAAGQMPPQIEVVVRTLLGDIDGAMGVAELLENPGEAFEMDLLWIPEFAPLRRHPDFIVLMENLGIAEYWDLHGCKFVDAAVTCPAS